MKKWAFFFALAVVILVLDHKEKLELIKKPLTQFSQLLRSKKYEQSVEPISTDNQYQSELALAEAEIVKLSQENQHFRELMETPLDPSWGFLPAQVISLADDKLVINVGKKHGLSSGEIVISLLKKEYNNGVVIGRIKAADDYQSTVELLSSDQSAIKVRTVNGIKGVVKGEGGQLRLDEVLQKDDLVKGEWLYSLGADGWLPDLLVGKVGEIEKEDTAVFKKAAVEWLLPLDQLVSVWVVSR